MILEELGELSTAQDLTAGTTDSENVIDLGAIANVGFGEMWLSIVTETLKGAAAGTTSTYAFSLVVASETTLDNYRTVMEVSMGNAATVKVPDPRIAVADRNICVAEVGQMIGDVADATYRYLGLRSVLADGNGTATVSINAALSPSKPRSKDNVQVVRSNIGVPT